MVTYCVIVPHELASQIVSLLILFLVVCDRRASSNTKIMNLYTLLLKMLGLLLISLNVIVLDQKWQ